MLWLGCIHLAIGLFVMGWAMGLPKSLLHLWKVRPWRDLGIWVGGLLGWAWLPPWEGVVALLVALASTAIAAKKVFVGWRSWEHSTRLDISDQQRRMMVLRGQLARLHEQERLSVSIEKTKSERSLLNASHIRFQVILEAIENHLALGAAEHTEELITLFGKHLRGVLTEASAPFIKLGDSLDGIQNYLALMEALTGDRLVIDMDVSAIPELNYERMTRTFEISPWVEQMTWPHFEEAERNDSVPNAHRISAQLRGAYVVFQFNAGNELAVKLMGSTPGQPVC
jgi:hypothetical protein